MVEQVRVNPTEVRGYGNICEGHTLEDFIVSNSGLAKEKENIHGALTDVYRLVYSLYGLIFDFDKGAKQLYLHSDNDVVIVFGFREKSLVFKTTSHIGFSFVDGNLVVDDENYLFIDEGTTASHNDNWDGLQYMTRGSDGTTINNTGSGTLFERIKINNSTAPFSNGDFTVTLNILSVTGSDNRLRVIGATTCSGEPYAQVDYTLLSTSIGEFKMVYDSTNHTVKTYKDGTLIETTNRKLCGNLNFNFRIPTGNSLKYKDFKVY